MDKGLKVVTVIITGFTLIGLTGCSNSDAIDLVKGSVSELSDYIEDANSTTGEPELEIEDNIVVNFSANSNEPSQYDEGSEALDDSEKALDGSEDTLGGSEEASSGSGHVIENFEITYQNPELPTGCESVALTMLVNYYGVYADKIEMVKNYLPTLEATFYYDENGNKIGPDMENYFVGDPFGKGYICGVSAIKTEADTWLEAQGSSLRATDKTGIDFDSLYSYIDNDTPVLVWVTIYMADRGETQGWYTEDGRWMEWATNDHGAVLIGYSDSTVTIADPISGQVEYDREQFEKVFTSRGCRALILEEH